MNLPKVGPGIAHQTTECCKWSINPSSLSIELDFDEILATVMTLSAVSALQPNKARMTSDIARSIGRHLECEHGVHSIIMPSGDTGIRIEDIRINHDLDGLAALVRGHLEQIGIRCR